MPEKILIVEDDDQLRAALAAHFQNIGFGVDCARERREAEALLTQVNYSLLITDLGLTPLGLDGFDVLDFTSNRNPRPKVIVLTGRGTPIVEYEAKFRGIDAFLKKPQTLKAMTEVVDRLLQRPYQELPT